MSDTRVRFQRPIVRRIALIAVLALLAESCAQSPQNRLYRAADAAFQRALLLPLNVVIAMPGELEPGAERVDQALHGYLAERGKSIETLGLAPARSAWLASAGECKANAGNGCQGFDGAARVLARRLREGHEYEVLIVPYLLFRPTRMRLSHVAWDGVERRLERINDSPDHNPIDSVPIEGPSLAVFAFSRDGDKLFQGVGGLDLAHRLRVLPGKRAVEIRWALELREDLFGDPALLREGVAIALDPLLPRSDPVAP